MKFGLNVI